MKKGKWDTRIFGELQRGGTTDFESVVVVVYGYKDHVDIRSIHSDESPIRRQKETIVTLRLENTELEALALTVLKESRIGKAETKAIALRLLKESDPELASVIGQIEKLRRTAREKNQS